MFTLLNEVYNELYIIIVLYMHTKVKETIELHWIL